MRSAEITEKTADAEASGGRGHQNSVTKGEISAAAAGAANFRYPAHASILPKRRILALIGSQRLVNARKRNLCFYPPNLLTGGAESLHRTNERLAFFRSLSYVFIRTYS